MNDLLGQVHVLTKERDEAREWVRKLQQTTQILTCVYCGQEYPPNTPTHGASVLTEHIKVCEKHPIRKAEADRDKLRRALAGLVGVETERELETMEVTIRMMQIPDVDRMNLINAITALLDTMP